MDIRAKLGGVVVLVASETLEIKSSEIIVQQNFVLDVSVLFVVNGVLTQHFKELIVFEEEAVGELLTFST